VSALTAPTIRFTGLALNGISEMSATGTTCARTQIQRNSCNLPLTLIPRRTGERALAKIVDDDSAVQATIRLLPERAGHSAAGDGRKGLALFEAEEFDLLFLDIFMPGMYGLETMRLAHRQRPLTPIIVISGNPLTWDSRSGSGFPGHGHQARRVTSLQKPFMPAVLLTAVDDCLAAAKRRPSSPMAADDIVFGP
jgi:CheY-like chemotaxis protein